MGTAGVLLVRGWRLSDVGCRLAHRDGFARYLVELVIWVANPSGMVCCALCRLVCAVRIVRMLYCVGAVKLRRSRRTGSGP